MQAKVRVPPRFLTKVSRLRARLLFSVLLTSTAFCQSQVNVLTYHNDNTRSGANRNETQLTWTNVVVGTFGKLFTLTVDGVVFAQPLYVSGLTVKGAVHNLVIVATENNSIYAFDADTGGEPLWHTNFNYGPPGVTVTPVPDADIHCGNVAPVVGITSTPVINGSTKILYAVAKTKEVSTSATSYFHRLHGVNLRTGAEVFPQVEITASVPGQCGNSNGTIAFDPLLQHQRASLLFLNDVVYIGSGSHCDLGNYYGWLFGYNVTTQQQAAAVNFAPDSTNPECRAGLWQGGGGPAADPKGNLYVVTANGAFNANTGGLSYGDSVLRLSTTLTGAVSVADYFTPMNQMTLNVKDLDFGGSGPVLLSKQPGPSPDLMVAAGKFGTIYLINRDNMGKYNPGGDQVVQSLPAAVGDGNDGFPPPVYFNERVYFAASRDSLKGFSLQNGLFNPTPFAVSETLFGYLGAGLAISADTEGGNAIVWAVDGTQFPGSLHAYNANTLQELYNSNQAPNNADTYGRGVRFSVPTIANGKVYVGAQSGVIVFGLKPAKAVSLAAQARAAMHSVLHVVSRAFSPFGSPRVASRN